MPQYSRTVKYKKLRDEIAMDNEAHINPRSRDLEPYAERINTIAPAILPETTPNDNDPAMEPLNPVHDFDSALRHLNEVIERTLDKGLPPVASSTPPHPDLSTAELFVSTRKPYAEPAPIRKPKPDVAQTAELFPSSKKTPTIRPFMVEEPQEERPAKKQPVQNPYEVDEQKTEQIQKTLFADPDIHFHPQVEDTPSDQRQKSADEIRNEVEQLMRGKTLEEPDTDTYLRETRELQRELDAHEDEMNGFHAKMDETHKLMNTILWFVILALVVVLLVIIYFIYRAYTG